MSTSKLYEVWDRETGNRLGEYESENDALSLYEELLMLDPDGDIVLFQWADDTSMKAKIIIESKPNTLS